jgi:glucosamine kinase
MAETSALFLGIDGGGTASRAVLMHAGRRIEAVGGPANATSDFRTAVQSVTTLVTDLARAADLPRDAVRHATAYLGLAGVGSADIGRDIAKAVDMPHAIVAEDQITGIVGALGDADGAVIAIGTGSYLGRQTAGTIRLVGGWGFYIGDQASGAWIGRRLFEHMMLVHDGIAAPSALTDQIAKADFGAGGLVRFSFVARPADYARFAPVLVEAAAAGDAFARSVMQDGATYLQAALATLGWRSGEPLCLIGGLAPAYAPLLGQTITPAKGSALDGALTLAMRQKRDAP